VSLLNQFVPERRQQVSLPTARRAKDQNVLGSMETFSGGSSAVTRSATTRRFAPRLKRSFGKSGSRTAA